MKSRRPLVYALLVLVAALLLAMAGHGPQGDKRVVVYTAHSTEDIEALAPAFEAEAGVRVEAVKLGSAEVVTKVKAEAKAPQADVIWSIAGDQLEGLSDLLAPAPPAEAGAVDPALVVSPRWTPYTKLTICLLVNTGLVPEAERPRSWADLADPRWKGKISMARADASGSAYMQLVTILEALGEAKGWEVYRGLLANAVLTPSSSAVPRLVNDGEAALGLTLEDAAVRYVRGGGPVTVVYPAEGTVSAVDGVALVAGGPHPDEARRFVAWAVSKTTQDRLATVTGRRPARPGSQTPGGLPPMDQVKTFPYPFAKAAAQKDALVARWKALATELGK